LGGWRKKMLEGELLEYFMGKNPRWKIIRYLIKNPNSNTTQISKGVQQKISNTSVCLKELKERNLVKYKKTKTAEKEWDTEVEEVIFGFIKKKKIDWYFATMIFSMGLGFLLLFLNQHTGMAVSFLNTLLVLLLRIKETKEIK